MSYLIFIIYVNRTFFKQGVINIQGVNYLILNHNNLKFKFEEYPFLKNTLDRSHDQLNEIGWFRSITNLDDARDL